MEWGNGLGYKLLAEHTHTHKVKVKEEGKRGV